MLCIGEQNSASNGLADAVIKQHQAMTVHTTKLECLLQSKSARQHQTDVFYKNNLYLFGIFASYLGFQAEQEVVVKIKQMGTTLLR